MRAATLLAGLVSAFGCLGLFVAPAAAQKFPAKVVKLVVPQAPGGATDVFARKIGQTPERAMGTAGHRREPRGRRGCRRHGCGREIPPDGYTLLVTYAGSQAINPSLYPKMPFDSIKDFQTVATLAVTPFVFIAHPKLPARDLAELIALARAKPDALTYASSGNGSVNHLLGEMLKAAAGIKMLHVPYRGVAPAITDVIGGQVDTAFSSVPSVLQMVRNGRSARSRSAARSASRSRRRSRRLRNRAFRVSTSIPGGEFSLRPASTWRSYERSTRTLRISCARRR